MSLGPGRRRPVRPSRRTEASGADIPSLAKAYANPAFLGAPAARPLRILAEYLEPQARFDTFKISDTIVFMGSARFLPRATAEARLEAARQQGEGVEAATTALELARYYEDARTLARRLTEWSKALEGNRRRFVICSGGGPGIMEAANRGASEARGVNIGLNISLPLEQHENPYTTRELAFQFHYFFMRKFWFVYLAKAIVFFPGGFGTLDEFFEVMTLVQTRKLKKKMPVVLYGTPYWDKVLRLEGLVEWGAIDRADLALMHRTDDVDDAFAFLTRELADYALPQPGGSL